MSTVTDEHSAEVWERTILPGEANFPPDDRIVVYALGPRKDIYR